jgi:SAM-dependent methyltransferase
MPHDDNAWPRCPACHSGIMAPIFTVSDPASSPPIQTQILCCSTCGTGKTGALPTETEVRSKNDALYATETSYAQRVLHEGHLIRCVDDAEWILERAHLRRRRASRRHLDIGCSSGGMMTAFGRLGFESYGIEPSNAADCAPAEIAHRIQKCYFGEEVCNGSFDLITAFHVLEHVVDPEAFLMRCRGQLSSDGILVIEVPDFTFAKERLQSLPAALLTHVSPYYHVHHFTAAGLRELVSRVGFKNVRIDRVAPRVRVISKTSSIDVRNSSAQPKFAEPNRERSPLRLRPAIRNALWQYRPVRMWSRHILGHTLGFGQHLRMTAVRP